jgi:beta-1,4-mannosyl-glycoprotein beta-1,4-N-acetylglucosaminyltransferase
MKVIDVFPFFNELDILEIRLNILEPFVDYFVISESTKAFQGQDKPLYYNENKEKFSKFSHKIIHNIVEEPDEKVLQSYGAKYNNGVPAQQRDIYQKDIIKEIVLKNSEEGDAIIWGDLDEVPNPDAVQEIPKFFESNTIYHFAQENCLSYINFVETTGLIQSMTLDFDADEDTCKKWLGTKLFDRNILQKNTLTQLRSYDTNVKNSRIYPGGWHWSYVGSDGLTAEERIIKKIEYSSHPEINNDHIKNKVKYCLENNVDPLGRDFANYKIVEVGDNYPKYIIDNKEKFDHLIKK